jgi:hypothetical protein
MDSVAVSILDGSPVNSDELAETIRHGDDQPNPERMKPRDGDCGGTWPFQHTDGSFYTECQN